MLKVKVFKNYYQQDLQVDVGSLSCCYLFKDSACKLRLLATMQADQKVVGPCSVASAAHDEPTPERIFFQYQGASIRRGSARESRNRDLP